MKLSLIGAVVALALTGVPALAEVTIKDAWVRATPGAAKVTAGYAVIVNTGTKDDTLTAVRSPLAGMSHLHASTGSDGVMRMESVKELAIPAGKETALKPGAYHIMVMGLTQPLKAGETLPLIFTFKDHGDVEVTARVMPLGN